MNREMAVKSPFKNKVALWEIENCHYVYSHDLVRINMAKLRQLVELSNFITQLIQAKYADLARLRQENRKKSKKKRHSAIEE